MRLSTGVIDSQLRAVTMERIKALDAVITSVDQALKITHSLEHQLIAWTNSRHERVNHSARGIEAVVQARARLVLVVRHRPRLSLLRPWRIAPSSDIHVAEPLSLHRVDP